MFEDSLFYNANYLSRLVTRLWKSAYAELGLAPSHAYLLRLVLEKPGLAQRDIVVELGLEKSTITRFIDKMVAKGYLVREKPDDAVGHEFRIYPTDAAIGLEKDLVRIEKELLSLTRAKFDDGELEHLIRQLRNLIQTL